MKKLQKLALFVLFSLFLLPLTGSMALELARGGKTDYAIVLPDSPSPVQETAASELASYLEKITGVSFPIVSENGAPSGENLLIIGPSALSAKTLAQYGAVSDKELAYDQVLVQPCGNSVVLSGHPQRGMLYAVYSFLENDLGCRWWTAQLETVPVNPAPSFEVTPVNFTPPLQYRELFARGFSEAENIPFAVKMRCNSSFAVFPETLGGAHRNVLGHSLYRFISPIDYFKDHPEWFSEVNGVRKLGFTWDEPIYSFLQSLPEENRGGMTEGATQLCFTNEEMIAEMTRKILAELRAHPNTELLSVSQNDNNKGLYCHCPQCQAVDEAEGSPAGSLLFCVNKVAEAVEEEFPNLYIDTFAYNHTRKPPKNVRARSNVVVRVCSDASSYIQPLRSGEQNQEFAQTVRGWAQKTDHLAMWDYNANFVNLYIPFPCYRVVKDNIQFFADEGVFWLFEQCPTDGGEGNFIQLQVYVTAKLMWDPSLDTESLMREFIAAYYAPELVPVYMDYFNLIADRCENSGAFLSTILFNTDSWLDLDTYNQMVCLFDQATQIADDLARKDPQKYADLPKKVEYERFVLDMVTALSGDVFMKQAQEEGKEFLGPKDMYAASVSFFERFEKVNGMKFREAVYPKMWEEFKATNTNKYLPAEK